MSKLSLYNSFTMLYKIIIILFSIVMEMLLNKVYFYTFMAIYMVFVVGLIYKLYKNGERK